MGYVIIAIYNHCFVRLEEKMEDTRPSRGRRRPEDPAQKTAESLVYGKNPVAELLKSGAGVDTVLLAEGMAPAVAA